MHERLVGMLSMTVLLSCTVAASPVRPEAVPSHSEAIARKVALSAGPAQVNAFANHGGVQAVLFLGINRTAFCLNAPDWTITVTGAVPNSDVLQRECRRDRIEGWLLAWQGSIGVTNSAGSLVFTTHGPNVGGEYLGQVIVAGDVSNPISYFAGAC